MQVTHRQSYKEYLKERRERLMVNYAIKTGKDEISKMQERILFEKNKLENDKNTLKFNETKFDDNVKTSERGMIEAIINAERQANRRIAKADELRALQAKILHIQADISRNDSKLYDYKGYQKFLESLVKLKEKETSRSMQDVVAPSKSTKMDLAEKRQTEEENVDENGQSKQSDVLGTVLKAVIKFQRRLQVKPPTKDQPKVSAEHHMSSDEELDLSKYFKHPRELVDFLKDLEVSNLALIQNCQDAEETIDSMRKIEKRLIEDSETEVKKMTEKVKELREIILKMDEEYIEEFYQETMPAEIVNEEEEFKRLCENIDAVYKECNISKEIKEEVLSGNKHNSAVAQFAQIEAHIAALLKSISKYPPERVAALRVAVRNERRNEFRKQQREEELRRQEERNRRILERAQAPPPDVVALRKAAIKLANQKKVSKSKDTQPNEK